MAITLKYGAPGPVLLAGFAGGEGRRQQRQQEDALDVWQQQQQQQFQARQAGFDRLLRVGLQDQAFEFQAGQQARALGFQAGQAGMDRTFRAGEAGLRREFEAGERELDRAQSLELAKRREEFLRGESTLEGLRKGELELPPAADRRLKELEAGRVEAMKLDPVQQAEFMERYEAEKRTLLGLSQPKPQQPIGAQFDQNTMERDGTLYQRNPNGGFDVLREKPEDPALEMEQKRNDAIMKQYEKNLSETDDVGDPLYKDEDEALQAAIDRQNKIERGRQRLLGGVTQPAAPAPAAQPSAPELHHTLPGRGEQGAQVMSAAEFDAKWATLSPGQSLRGPDGKIYTKKGQ